MRRASVVLAELVNDIDSVAGKHFTKWNYSADKNRIRDIPKEIIICNAEIFIEGCGRILEYWIAKPVYHIENVLVGKRKQPAWTYHSR